MPRFKPKGVLERSAAIDLWKKTLSQIPTAVGKLVYLSSLRDPNSGIYEHHGLSSLFGRDQSQTALRESHEKAFLEWIRFTMAEKHADLGQYLAGLEPAPGEEVSRQAFAEHWLSSRIYETHVPAAA